MVRSGSLTAKGISNVSGITRQDIYRLTNDLLEKGIVKKELGIPNIFEAIPLAEAIKILEKEEDEERLESRKKSQLLLKRYENGSFLKSEPEKEFNISLIPRKDALQFTINRIKESKKSIDVVTSGNKVRFMIWTAKDSILEALNRNVKFRVILDSSADIKKLLKKITKNPFFKIRTMNYQTSVAISVYDNKKISLMLKQKENISEANLLTTNNVSLLEIFCDYFETKWFSASEVKLLF